MMAFAKALLIVGLIALNAFFAAAEYALLSVRRTRIEQLAREGDTRARLVQALLSDIGLLISGGLGNLYDRIVFACVRDFLHPLPGVYLPFGWQMPFSGGRELWPYVSNIADLWLLVGIGMLMWYLWRGNRQQGAGGRLEGNTGARPQSV